MPNGTAAAEQPKKRRDYSFEILGAAILLILLLLLCLMKIICPSGQCSQSQISCPNCPGGCCLPDGSCPCPQGYESCATSCGAGLNCPQDCCAVGSCTCLATPPPTCPDFPASCGYSYQQSCCIDCVKGDCLLTCGKDPKRIGCSLPGVDSCDSDKCCPSGAISWSVDPAVPADSCCKDRYGNCIYSCTVDPARKGCPSDKKGTDACDSNSCCPSGSVGWSDVLGCCVVDVGGQGTAYATSSNLRCIQPCLSDPTLSSCPNAGVGGCGQNSCCPTGSAWDGKCCLSADTGKCVYDCTSCFTASDGEKRCGGAPNGKKCVTTADCENSFYQTGDCSNKECSNNAQCKKCDQNNQCGGIGFPCFNDLACSSSACTNGYCCPSGSIYNTAKKCCVSPENPNICIGSQAGASGPTGPISPTTTQPVQPIIPGQQPQTQYQPTSCQFSCEGVGCSVSCQGGLFGFIGGTCPIGKECCGSDNVCKQCINGKCGGDPADGSCTSSADCQNVVCQNGHCSSILTPISGQTTDCGYVGNSQCDNSLRPPFCTINKCTSDGRNCADNRSISCQTSGACSSSQMCCCGYNCQATGTTGVGQCISQSTTPSTTSDPCAGVTCPSEQVCHNGVCVDSCSGVVCSAGQTCVNGSCVPSQELTDCKYTGSKSQCRPEILCSTNNCVDTDESGQGRKCADLRTKECKELGAQCTTSSECCCGTNCQKIPGFGYPGVCCSGGLWTCYPGVS